MPDFKAGRAYAASQGWLIVEDYAADHRRAGSGPRAIRSDMSALGKERGSSDGTESGDGRDDQDR
jgi:hypothetical protein